MARCEFAVWTPMGHSPGPYRGGHPFKILHHTTESPSASAAFEHYRATGNVPHFTVDDRTIYQHVDSEQAASALAHPNPSETTETNRSSAVQIELVGYAGRPENKRGLENVARLCRWIEAMHHVPPEWPNGYPKPAVNGKDPGNHNRNELNWDTKGGHYGHCHVPNNVHWDPAYTDAEVAAVMERIAPERHDSTGAEVMADHALSGHHSS